MKTIIITGSNSGIGKEAARILAREGHRILMLSRDSEKSRQAHQEIVKETSSENIFLVPVDLSNQDSTRKAVTEVQDRFDTVDVLVNNAGVMNRKLIMTMDDIEESFAVNFLAPYMLSELLIDNLVASGEGRIINLVPKDCTKGKIDLENLWFKEKYLSTFAYLNAKLALLLYTNQLANKYKDEGITINALHPGTLKTDLLRSFPNFIQNLNHLFAEKSVKGGERIAYLATSDKIGNVSGKFFIKDEQQEMDIPPQESDKTEALSAMVEALTLNREDKN